MWASALGAILNVVLNYIFIPKYGFLAAGYTTLACYLCYCVAHYILMRVIIKKELQNIRVYDMRIIVGISIIFVLVGSCAMVLYNIPIIRYSVIAVIIVIALINRRKLIVFVKMITSLKKSK